MSNQTISSSPPIIVSSTDGHIICCIFLSYSGAFTAIKNAYDESTDAAKTVDDSKNTVKESADVREETEDLQNQVQPVNTRDLDKLNQSMASRPDLTPVAKQVTSLDSVMLAILSKIHFCLFIQ